MRQRRIVRVTERDAGRERHARGDKGQTRVAGQNLKKQSARVKANITTAGWRHPPSPPRLPTAAAAAWEHGTRDGAVGKAQFPAEKSACGQNAWGSPFLSPVVNPQKTSWDFFLYGGVITMILFFGLVPSGVCRIGVPFCFLVSRNFAFELAGR